MSSFKKSNTSFLARYEKVLLAGIVRRLPAWVEPDALTLLGLVGSVLVFAGYALTHVAAGFLTLASLGLFLNWFGDSLDGTLARFRERERPRYGFFVDHVSDLASQVLIGFGLAVSVYIRMPCAFALLTVYLSFVGYTFIHACVFNEVRISYSSVGPSETRLALILANILFYAVPAVSEPIPGFTFSIADTGCAILVCSSFSVLAAYVYEDWKVLSVENALTGENKRQFDAPLKQTLPREASGPGQRPVIGRLV